LKEGEICNIVESDFGFHIIRLTAIKPATSRALSEVKDNIVDEIRRQQAGKKYAEMSEIFTNMVYEQSDSLKPVADKLGLKIEVVANLTRKQNAALPKGAAFNQPKFLTAIFSDESTRNKRNTEAVEVAPRVLIAGHVLEYKPVTKSPLSEVKAIVEDRVSAIEAEKIAKQAGETKLASVRAGADADFATTIPVSRNKTGGLAGPAVAAIMRTNTSKLPAYVGVALPGRGYSIYRINKVNENLADETIVKAEQQQVDEFLATQEMAAYLAVIKKRSKAEILKPVALAKTANTSNTGK
jgi:peptidyl-prolyl cis-trans isomerase D